MAFAAALAAAVVDLLDPTIAQVAAPSIRTSLGGSFADLEWISAAYTLAMAVVLLTGAGLGFAAWHSALTTAPGRSAPSSTPPSAA